MLIFEGMDHPWEWHNCYVFHLWKHIQIHLYNIFFNIIKRKSTIFFHAFSHKFDDEQDHKKMIYALLDCICCKNIALDHGYYPKKTWISSFGISKLGFTEKSSNMSKKFREIDFYCNFTSFFSIRVKTRSITMVKHQIICTFSLRRRSMERIEYIPTYVEKSPWKTT